MNNLNYKKGYEALKYVADFTIDPAYLDKEMINLYLACIKIKEDDAKQDVILVDTQKTHCVAREKTHGYLRRVTNDKVVQELLIKLYDQTRFCDNGINNFFNHIHFIKNCLTTRQIPVLHIDE